MFKRVAALISVFVAIIVLVGCGEKAETLTTQDSQLERNEVQTQEQSGRGMRDGSGRQRFSEAEEACDDKAEGDACQFTIVNEGEEDKTVSGTCKIPMQLQQQEEGLSCRPGIMGSSGKK